jgi:hypothetical protein
MTVTDESGKPVYGATVHIQIAYGFMGVRKADLDVGTNIDGKARFVGLPNKFDKGLQFKASKGDKEGTAAGNPATNCHAKHYIVIRKP